jgi:hypothetical protein
MGGLGFTPRIDSNLHYEADGKCWSYTQIFRNGAIEAVKVRVVSDLQKGELWIPTLDLDSLILNAFQIIYPPCKASMCHLQSF